MSMPKSYPLYAVWIKENNHGYQKGKAYYINIMMYPNNTLISIITKNDEIIEYENFISFLYSWQCIMMKGYHKEFILKRT